MPYDVVLAPAARKFFERADRPLRRKLARCFDQLERDPRGHSNIKRLTGTYKGYYRYRLGDHRVIYRIDADGQLVLVAIIATRGDAYE